MLRSCCIISHCSWCQYGLVLVTLMSCLSQTVRESYDDDVLYRPTQDQLLIDWTATINEVQSPTSQMTSPDTISLGDVTGRLFPIKKLDGNFTRLHEWMMMQSPAWKTRWQQHLPKEMQMLSNLLPWGAVLWVQLAQLKCWLILGAVTNKLSCTTSLCNQYYFACCPFSRASVHL